MKKILFLMVGMFMIGFASASITISTENATIYNFYSEVPIDFSSTFGDVEVYISNDTNFGENNLICEFTSSGTYQCNFTAFYTGAFEDDCFSIYEFGDGGTAIGDDIGVANADCTNPYSATIEENCGMIRSCANMADSTGGGMACGDVRDSFFGITDNFTIMSWAKFPTEDEAFEVAGQTFPLFYKADDQPKLYIRGGGGANLSAWAIWGSTVSPAHSIGGPPGTWEYDRWQFISASHRNDDWGFLYDNGILSIDLQMYTSYSPGSLETIGGEISGRKVKGKMDELRMCNRLFNEADLAQMYIYKEGLYYFKINNSNGDTEYGMFRKDLNNPLIDLNFPIYESGTGFINFTAEDFNLFSNVSANITLDGVQIAFVDFNVTIFYINNTQLELGEHNLTILVTDLSGRTTTKEKIFEVINLVEINVYDDDKIGILSFFSDLKIAILNLFGGTA